MCCEIGWNLGALGKSKEALYYLNRAKELGRDDVWINSELGWNMGRLDRNEEAVYYLNRAKELGRDDNWIFEELGWNLGILKNMKRLLRILLYQRK